MKDTWPLLDKIAFPAIARGRCKRCRSMSAIAATSPACIATSMPGRAAPRRWTVRPPISCSISSNGAASRRSTSPAARRSSIAHFRRLVTAARDMGVKVMDRHNLTVQEQPGQEDLAEFLAANQVEVVASMPCYLQDNVDKQRGKGVYDGSIRGAAAAQRARLRPRRVGPHAQSRLQSARALAAAAAGRA